MQDSFGSPTWTRTRDLRINSTALYQLSYQGIDKAAILLTVGSPVNRQIRLRGPFVVMMKQGKFVVKKGLISKIDMVETARMSDRQGASGGRTHFDELSGALEVDNNSQHLRQIRISAGIMSANGDVDIGPDKQVSGRMNVSLKVRAERSGVPLAVSGTLAEPVWRVGR